MSRNKAEGVNVKTSLTIGEYLINRLLAHGVRHIFGVPGDYVIGFYKQLLGSKIKIINTCDEQGAAFAADAYARLNGLGAVAITYNVGGLKTANGAAQAYAESSPVVIISGAPGTNERAKDPLLHHRVRDFDTQLKVFKELTAAQAVLDDPFTAFFEIDRVIASAIREKRPVYIELPRDMVRKQGTGHQEPRSVGESPDPLMFGEAIEEAVEMINNASKPAIVAGIEISRFGLRDKLARLAQQTGIPVASTMLSKTVFGECQVSYMGVYEGKLGFDDVREYVESGDCTIFLGALLTDIDLGIFTARIDRKKFIHAIQGKVTIKNHDFPGIGLTDFVDGLLSAKIVGRDPGHIPHPERPRPFKAIAGRKINVKRLFDYLNSFLTNDLIVIADTGDSLFAGTDLFIECGSEFMSSAYYTSMGFAVPAAVGAQLARPDLRPVVLVGDGAFQMTGMELSTIARFNLNPIVVVLNNGGYGTERFIEDGSFNDIKRWRYDRIPEVLGAGVGFAAQTEDELVNALSAARENTDGFSIIDVRLGRLDASPTLKRIARGLAEKVHA